MIFSKKIVFCLAFPKIDGFPGTRGTRSKGAPDLLQPCFKLDTFLRDSMKMENNENLWIYYSSNIWVQIFQLTSASDHSSLTNSNLVVPVHNLCILLSRLFCMPLSELVQYPPFPHLWWMRTIHCCYTPVPTWYTWCI